MYDMDEQEIMFEQIGLSENAVQIGKIKKIIKLNLKIKRVSKQKGALKGCKSISKDESNSIKPSKEYCCDEIAELKNENSKSELTPKLCNGESCPATDQILNAIEELRDLVKRSCNETREIRKEVLGFKNTMVDDNPSYVPFMRGPCQTLDDFNLLENRVHEDEFSRKALENLLDKIVDPTLEKYVRCCLHAVLSLKVASQCSWLAKKDSSAVSVHNMAIIGVICDCTRKKFPTASSSHIEKIMRKWFVNSKDRWRRSSEAKHFKTKAEEQLT